jgi:proline iminopeptidase
MSLQHSSTKGQHPYKKGYLHVGDGHELYFECCGKKDKPAILFLHGGPGGGFHKKDKDFFNLNKWNLILFDQRGSGRSKPFASLKHNTTDDLVEDINKLLDHLGLKKVFLFGGSWGSTLALIYAIRNPSRVHAMVLRGIYLATKSEEDFYVHGGVANFYPEEFEKMISLVPVNKRKAVLQYYAHKMMTGSKQQQEKYAYAWSTYEMSISRLVQKDVKKTVREFPALSLGRLETYYLAHGCFIPEGYILNNVHKLKMPVTIVQGRYDLVCPPISAFQLAKKLPRGKLHVTTSGHSSGDPQTKQLLKKEVERLLRRA